MVFKYDKIEESVFVTREVDLMTVAQLVVHFVWLGTEDKPVIIKKLICKKFR